MVLRCEVSDDSEYRVARSERGAGRVLGDESCRRGESVRWRGRLVCVGVVWQGA